MSAYEYAYVWEYVCLHVFLHTYVYNRFLLVCVCMPISVHMAMCVHVCVCVCVHLYMIISDDTSSFILKTGGSSRPGIDAWRSRKHHFINTVFLLASEWSTTISLLLILSPNNGYLMPVRILNIMVSFFFKNFLLIGFSPVSQHQGSKSLCTSSPELLPKSSILNS